MKAWRFAHRYTGTIILSEHFQAHRHLCTDLLQFKTILLVFNINCYLSHKHYAPERPVWSIQTLGFPEAITISIIRSWKTQIYNPRTIKICYWNCFEIKAWTLVSYNAPLGTLCLKDTPNLMIPLSVDCNSDYCNYVTLRKCVHTTESPFSRALMLTVSGA